MKINSEIQIPLDVVMSLKYNFIILLLDIKGSD